MRRIGVLVLIAVVLATLASVALARLVVEPASSTQRTIALSTKATSSPAGFAYDSSADFARASARPGAHRLVPNTPLAPSTAGTPRAGLGVNDTLARVSGPWSDADLGQGVLGRPPRSLGSPELHHADEMPGARDPRGLPWASPGDRGAQL